MEENQNDDTPRGNDGARAPHHDGGGNAHFSGPAARQLPGMSESFLIFIFIFAAQYALTSAALPSAMNLSRIAPRITGSAEVVASLISELMILTLLLYYLFYYRRFDAVKFGLSLRSAHINVLRGFGYAVTAFIGAIVVSGIIFTAIYVYLSYRGMDTNHIIAFFTRGVSREKEVFRLVSTPLGMVFGVMVAPFFEEMMFRGMLYRPMRERLPVWAAAILSSAVFTGLHFYFLGAPAVFVLAMTSALVYEYHGSLMPCIFLHAFWNLRAFIFGYFQN